MIRTLLILTLFVSTSVIGQTTPRVRLNTDATSFQRTLYPRHYKNADPAADQRWVEKNDSALAAFWKGNESRILTHLSRLSGIEWMENSFDIYLVRYYPSLGEAEPLILPVGGIRVGDIIESAPSGSEQQLNLIFQLARRILSQTARPGTNVTANIANHPLIQPGYYRRDNLAMTLAMVVCSRTIGSQATLEAYNAPVWRRNFPGRDIFEEHFQNVWQLSEDRPLVTWLLNESYTGTLVSNTRETLLPRVSAPESETVGDIPATGRLGMSIGLDPTGRLYVLQLDPSRLASQCGLLQDDILLTVDNNKVKSHKELVEFLLAGLEKGSVKVRVLRAGKNVSVVLRPLTESDESLTAE